MVFMVFHVYYPQPCPRRHSIECWRVGFTFEQDLRKSPNANEMASAIFLYGISLTVNIVGWAISSHFKTDLYYDLTGSATHVIVIATSLFYAPNPTLRQFLGSVLVITWAVRLGSFLFSRIIAAGGDRRLTKYKARPLLFLIPWTIQSVWVFLNCLPVILSNNLGGGGPSLGFGDAFALICWVSGFTIQVLADEQKKAFAAASENRGRWISTGVWALCRHPNSAGEITMGWSLAVLSWPALQGMASLAVLSPLFETALLLRVSGIPLLEREGEKRWGYEPAYRKYIADTPVLIPWIKT